LSIYGIAYFVVYAFFHNYACILSARKCIFVAVYRKACSGYRQSGASEFSALFQILLTPNKSDHVGGSGYVT